MARPLRIEFAGAIYHVMARGNGRQLLFYSEDDYQRMLDGLEATVDRTGWEVFAFAWMPNHIHLLFRTPQPNLSRGMQYLLSGYANWFAKRHDRPGHLFQGRFRGELIEDETYYWNVSRYIHLNPTRGTKPLVEHPKDWRWSSYPGYAHKRHRLDWVKYDPVYEAWQGEKGGGTPEVAYRKFVEAGLVQEVENPFHAALEGWLLGGQTFLDRIKKMLKETRQPDQVPQLRKIVLTPQEVLQTVAQFYEEEFLKYSLRRSKNRGRDMAAYLAHRHTTATLRELAGLFGLSHPDSVSNLVRRAEKAIRESASLRLEMEQLQQLLKTGSDP